MSDQADSLRQLVRAQRQWRELALQEQSAALASGPFAKSAMPQLRTAGHDRPSGPGHAVGQFVGRAVRWAVGRRGVRKCS